MKSFFAKNSIKEHKFSFIIFLVFTLYTVVSLFVGLGALNFVGAVMSAALALVACGWMLLKKDNNRYLTAAYAVTAIGNALFVLVWGADALGRVLFGFVLMLPALVFFFFFFLSVKRAKKSVIRYGLAVCVLGCMVAYILFMDLRYRPINIVSLQAGHDEYLNNLKANGTPEDSPNILFIVMDDLGYADISSYTYKDSGEAIIQTPNIDSIAEYGVMFENFYASSPVCSPSRFGIMTGRYSARGYVDNVVFPSDYSVDPYNYFRFVNTFEFQNNVQGILADEITMPEALQAAGYSTAGFGKWHLGDTGQYLPANQGFDYFFGTLHVNDVPNYEFYRNTPSSLEKVVKNRDMDQSITNRLLTDEVLNYINTATDNNEKFFAYYASPWPHEPLSVGADFEGTSDGGTYGDCIEEFDAYLGEIFDLLKEKGVYDDTVIVFTSDNGPGKQGATGALRGRKGTTFDGGQKVPLIMKYGDRFSSQPEGRTITSHTMNINFFPTLLSLAGIDSLPQDRIIDGRNMAPLLYGEIPPDSVVNDVLYHIRRGKVQAVQTAVEVDGELVNFKYYKSVQNENSAFFNQTYKNYTFNLDLDPAEAYNITPNNEDLAKQLAKKLDAFAKELQSNRRGAT